MEVLGIDVGGSGIKGAPVDVDTGLLLAERYRVPTPQPSTPDAVGDAVKEIVDYFTWNGPLGCAFPAVIKKGVAYTAANVDKAWIGAHGERLLRRKTKRPVVMLNDGDAAGIAEMTFGAGRGRPGVVIVLTFGTGVGSALFVDGRLVPNTELGHLEIRGKNAEMRASDRARQEKGWTWEQWAKRVDEYLNRLEMLFSPDLFIVGGGVSKDHRKFMGLLDTRARIVPARMLNDAGMVGAALAVKARMQSA